MSGMSTPPSPDVIVSDKDRMTSDTGCKIEINLVEYVNEI